MRRTLKYRLYVSKRDEHLIGQIHAAASVWNHSVALTRRYYSLYGKHLGANRLMKHIARLRRRNPYGQRLGSQAVQDVCQRLDKAYQRFFSLSDGTGVRSPEFFRHGMQEVREASRRLSRKKRGSNNRRKARVRLAKTYDRILRRRRDWFFKTAHSLCDRYDFIAIEDLNLDGMKRLWGRKVSDLGFAEFVALLKHVAKKRGVRVETVERYFPSSKTCSGCGWVKRDLRLADREWVCEECGSVHDRDENAATNIRDRALSHSVGDVSHATAADRRSAHAIAA